MTYSDNPVLLRRWRSGDVESQHRGAWVLVDSSGTVVDSAGHVEQPVFARSSTKPLQAIPLVESGAAGALGLSSEALAIAMASHRAEPVHVDLVDDLLNRLGLNPEHLQCGVPRGADSAVEHECSGKHAGFLALALHLAVDPADYLDRMSLSQKLVAETVADLCKPAESAFSVAVDGCSAPTFRLPLTSLASGIARLTNPADLAPSRVEACTVLTTAARAHPELIAGTSGRFDTEVMRATEGRLLAKTGADGVQVIGEIGGDRAMAIKIDDGTPGACHRVAASLIERLGLASPRELIPLDRWTDPAITNTAGLVVGRNEFL